MPSTGVARARVPLPELKCLLEHSAAEQTRIQRARKPRHC